ncbi:Ferritin and Dps [Lyngbya sp. PCC 8106]|uniref:Ferritin and Dps n=1 Tax=Lyngbya sp. (strain PCC 8106) TaxID=313612 RepID=UPI0000EAC274|nr:Ferritin and Dps [Lyngbya sp. PCC 8106]EAW34875.1 Ferritin and Dps [Lyngbya sp. PCC 8106]
MDSLNQESPPFTAWECQLGDADTADLYTEISRTVDMRLWFLEAHLQGSNGSATNGSSSATKTAAQVK